MHDTSSIQVKTVTELFEAQVQKTPYFIALRDKNIAYTYVALNEKANQFARWLQKNSVHKGDFVGILLEPSTDFIICILAIIKLGAIYVPLDIIAPQLRLKEITDDSNPKLIITCEKYKAQLENTNSNIGLIKHINMESIHQSRDNLNIVIVPKSPIYLMYTSGSTGKPKGIIIPHDAVVNLVKIDNYASIVEGKILAQFSNPSFDACTFEIWSALLNGAILSMIPIAVRTNHNSLKDHLNQDKINCLFLPTGYFHQLVKSFPDTLDSIEMIIFGGEQANPSLIKKFLTYRKTNTLPITLINGYGPTEATTFTSRRILTEKSVLDDEELMSIGKPIHNVKTYILDEHKNPTTEGELYISGVNLALGYHHSKNQNQEKFFSNPFEQKAPYHRIYKTGDKVKRLPSGNLLCLGRFDDQVKIGGFRIHLNEIENALMKHETISLAAVVSEVGGEGHKMLTAYIVFSSKEALTHANDIRQFLSLYLPTYMLPSKYVVVDELPLTLVGKIDKKNLHKLPHTDFSFQIDNNSSSAIEETIKNIWKHLLNRSNIEINKNLFELGANSLLITEACAKINKELHAELKISDLLSHPTIHRLSLFLEGDLDVPVIRRQLAISTSDIAVIGMSCRFPNANSIEEFWNNICQGKNCLERFTETDLLQTKNNLSQENFVPVKGILSDIERFDANFFGFNPIDASITDPQHRLFLECAWEALEHANVIPSQIDKTISVFAGMADSTYLHENLLKNSWVCQEHDRFQQRIASSIGMLSTQVSYRLNLKGRSLNINTACSTGLVTVAQACQELMMGTSDVALAGAVSVTVPQLNGYIPQQGGIESPDGWCRPFERHANGTVFSNGVGVIILKRLEDALADNNTIYSIIKGVGVNNDGSDKLGYTAPSVQGQISCIREALTQSKIKADAIGYVEAHGTATILGDVIEMEALSAVYREQTNNKQYCALGSVKGNIGHTDAASGMAGIIKTILCLYNKKIPPMLHFKEPNPDINFEESPFFINPQLIDWKKNANKRYAGVSSFGVGGTNAHIILSECVQEQSAEEKSNEYLMVLSAKTETALQQSKEKFIQFLKNSNKSSQFSLTDIAYTLQTGREAFQWRCYSSGQSKEEIIKNISLSKIKLWNENIHQNLIFMFPGQGMQYHQMASQLMNEIPFFSSLVQQGIQLATTYLGINLLDILNNPTDERLNQTQYAQPALFIIEYALANLLIHYGLKPNSMIGHSIGEYVAACLAGVFSFEDAIALVCQRGLLMAHVSAGEMLAVECTKSELSPYLNQAELALHNATNHCVVSGNVSGIDQLTNSLLKAGKTFRKLNVSHAFHSRSMEEIQQSFKNLFSNITLSAPRIPIVSNVTGTWLSIQEATDPNYWYKHLRQTVQFCTGLETLLENQHPFFIEVGPGQSLNVFLKEVACQQKKKINSINALPSSRSQQSEIHQLLDLIGMAWQDGMEITWPALYGIIQPRLVPLPTYSFQKQRYWIEPDQEGMIRNDFSPKLYKPVWSHQRAYTKSTTLSPTLLAQHSWIIFKDVTGLGDQLISLLKKNNIAPIVVTFDKTYIKNDDLHFEIDPSNKHHYVKFIQTIKNNVRNPIILHLASYSNFFNNLPSSEEIDKQLELGFYSLLYLSQAFTGEIKNNIPLKIGVITTGTQLVVGTEQMNPINATLIGPCRVIMQEHETFKFKLIDLDSTTHPQENINLLSKIIDICLQENWNESSLITPYRNGHEWHLTYDIVQPQPKKINRLKDNGIYLLTGGIGGIALSCCEAIVKTVSTPTFILLFRRKIPLEIDWENILQNPSHQYYGKIKQIRKLQKMGAKFKFYQVDITKFELLDAVIQQCINEFGKINGLIHTAGLSNAELVQYKTKATAQNVFLPKIYGTYNLGRALKDLSLDFVVFKSSLAALLGGFREIDYCGANACLDSFVMSDLFLFSSFIVSINWNTWREVGIAAEAALKGEPTFLGKGNDISPQQGQELFLKILQGNESQVAISNLNLNIDISMHGLIAFDPTSSGIKIARQDLNVVTNYLAPTNVTESKLTQLWQDMLGIEKIGINDDFFTLGGHSLKALNIIEKINKTFNCTLSATQIYRNPTIKQLCSTILHGSENKPENSPIPLKMVRKKPPYLFLFHPISGLTHCFNSFVSQSELSISIFGLQDPSIEANRMLYNSIFAMAKDYSAAIRKIQPTGPYFFLGYSFGGNILYEVANILRQQGETISLLAMIDSWAINSEFQQDEETFKKYFQTLHPELSIQLIDLAWKREELLLNHTPSKIDDQEIVLFKALQLCNNFKIINHATNGWSIYNKGNIICHKIDGNHDTIINIKNSRTMLYVLNNYLIQKMLYDETVKEGSG